MPCGIDETALCRRGASAEDAKLMELQTDPSSRKKRRVGSEYGVDATHRPPSRGSPVIKPDPEAEMHAASPWEE